MSNQAALVALLIVIFCSPIAVYAQDTPRNEKNPGGTLINQDYFTANQYTEVKELLSIVEAYHLNRRVMNAFIAGHYGEVLGDMKYTLDKFPNHPRALMLIGSIARIKGNISLPIPFYEKALKLYPQYPLIHAQYGSYLVDIDQMNTGIARLRQAIEIDPKLAVAHAWLAKAYHKNGDLESERQAAKKARELGYKGDIPEKTPHK